jgi:ribosomal protein L23
MSKMHVPLSIRSLRFNKNEKASGEKNKIKSLEYLIHVIKRVVVSEKYILDRNLLVLDVKPDAEKMKISMAIEGISENKVLKVTSSIRRSSTRNFKRSKGSTSEYKRMCLRLDSPFDISILSGGSQDE